VVSKPQIRFKGPAKRDYISDLNKLRYASSVRPIGKVVVLSIHGYVSIYRRSVLLPNLKNSDANPACGATQPLGLLSPLNNLSIRCEIPLHKAGRWGFEATSRSQVEEN
jgi:hypothetical protein